MESLLATNRTAGDAAVPDDAGGGPAAGAARRAVQHELPVRDAHVVHRLPARPGLRERGLRLQPQAALAVDRLRRAPGRPGRSLVVAGVIVADVRDRPRRPRRPGGDLGRPARLGRPRSPRRGGSSAWTGRPPVQLLAYFGGILSGNWGLSIHTHQPVLSDIGTAAPASLELVTAALIIALVVGRAARAGVGPLARAAWPTRPSGPGSILGVSMPIFWMALILQLVFSQQLHWLPAAGEYSPEPAVHPPAGPRHRVQPDRRAAHRELADVRQHPGPPRAARRGGGRLPGRADRPHGPGPGAGHGRRDPHADGPRARLPGAGRVRPVRR